MPGPRRVLLLLGHAAGPPGWGRAAATGFRISLRTDFGGASLLARLAEESDVRIEVTGMR